MESHSLAELRWESLKQLREVRVAVTVIQDTGIHATLIKGVESQRDKSTYGVYRILLHIPPNGFEVCTKANVVTVPDLHHIFRNQKLQRCAVDRTERVVGVSFSQVVEISRSETQG